MENATLETVLQKKARYSVILSDAYQALKDFPSNSIDCVITSPPYWQLREYAIADTHSSLVIGTEETLSDYIRHLTRVFCEVYRVLKPSGSFWLNLGDTYVNKNLLGIPWRVALALQDTGWILRNDVIWEKLKGTQPVTDRLRNNHEHIFHFVKNQRYYYNMDDIRIKPRLMPISTGENATSATGVSGKKYRVQITTSDVLTTEEKKNALSALEETLQQIRDGHVVDFRMTIRGNQRTLHGNGSKTSGRARELEQKGFFIMKSYAKGFAPSDIWRLVPEDMVKNRHNNHYAVFPQELLRIPILATCPPDGILLDPFVGTGSTIFASLNHDRYAIGIDISEEYINSITNQLSHVLF